MPTKIYGASDDLIEFDGDLDDDITTDAAFADGDGNGCLVICSDGTLLDVKYGKAGMAIWQVTVIVSGSLFDRLEVCTDEDAEVCSDVAHFKDGLKWAYVASEWQRLG
jgi:hypothetical protein